MAVAHEEDVLAGAVDERAVTGRAPDAVGRLRYRGVRRVAEVELQARDRSAHDLCADRGRGAVRRTGREDRGHQQQCGDEARGEPDDDDDARPRVERQGAAHGVLEHLEAERGETRRDQRGEHDGRGRVDVEQLGDDQDHGPVPEVGPVRDLAEIDERVAREQSLRHVGARRVEQGQDRHGHDGGEDPAADRVVMDPGARDGDQRRERDRQDDGCGAPEDAGHTRERAGQQLVRPRVRSVVRVDGVRGAQHQRPDE